jgi:ribosomal protein L11 methyltransferase
MTRRSKINPGTPAWRWRRAISREAESLWTERMGSAGELNWLIVERPQRVRLVVEAFFSIRQGADALARKWGGRVERFDPKPPKAAAPVRVSATLEIAHDEKAMPSPDRLIIPYGMAFGSGEHPTTLMLLRALAARTDLAQATVLDLGTGSGVLALAARKLGAHRIMGSDFDPDSIRTARQNEALNFSRRSVRWEVGDVRQLRERGSCSLILANLFSGILIEAAKRIARALSAGGELWLSGVLRSQQDEVAAAFSGAGLQFVTTVTRGKWVMQQWAKGRVQKS